MDFKNLIILAVVMASIVGLSVVADSNHVNLYKESLLGEEYTLHQSDTLALQFNANSSFDSVNIQIGRVYNVAETSKMVLSLYKWENSYKDTIKSDPLFTSQYENIKSNKSYSLILNKQDKGEYLFTLTCKSGSWNIASYATIENSRTYENGLEVERAFPFSITTPNRKDFMGKVSKNMSINLILNPKPDSWVAVDGLGRSLSGYEQVGIKKDNKFVGLFYWTGSAHWARTTSPYNVTELLNSVIKETRQAAKNDYNHELWKTTKAPTWFWDEPIYGYYNTTDSYVLRKQSELLADAGVDVIFFDCAVGLDTTGSYMNVFDIFAKARQQGVKTPDIAFMLPMGNLEQCASFTRKLYEQIYSKGLYEDLWFNWKGKPLILSYNNLLATNGIDGEIRDFFTFRKSDAVSWRTDDYISNPNDPMWGWLSHYPQTKYFTDGEGKKVEQITVGVAQNVDVVNNEPTAMNGNNVAGRSYVYGDYSYSYIRNGNEFVVTPNIEDSVLYGLNFQQQWDYAIAADPDFIFVTGWNEWSAGRYKEFLGIENAFPDQYNAEYSRDCEPSKGLLKDHYYYQLVENIRRFKGVTKPENTNVSKTINLARSLKQWEDISSFDHYEGSTWKRSNQSYGGILYQSDTLRNDIIKAKVAYDEDYIYFYVETLDKLTDSTDPAWMRLYLDTDFTGKSPNWEAFEYVINRKNPDGKYAYVERFLGQSQEWEEVGKAEYLVTDNILQIKVLRSMVQLDKEDLSFNFKWSDNMINEGDILDFYVNGDVAPGGRFMFSFTAKDQMVKTKSNRILLIAGFSFLSIVIAALSAWLIKRKKNG